MKLFKNTIKGALFLSAAGVIAATTVALMAGELGMPVFSALDTAGHAFTPSDEIAWIGFVFASFGAFHALLQSAVVPASPAVLNSSPVTAEVMAYAEALKIQRAISRSRLQYALSQDMGS